MLSWKKSPYFWKINLKKIIKREIRILKIRILLLFIAFTNLANIAHAQMYDHKDSTWWRQPNLLEVGLGAFDPDVEHPQLAAELHIHYIWNYSLISRISGDKKFSKDPYMQIRPFAALEVTSKKAFSAFGGLVFDIFLSDHIFICPYTSTGLYFDGDGKALGFPVEFHSAMDIGYRFNSNLRISASVCHISNAGLGQSNPGVQIYSLNCYFPMGGKNSK
jgi:hypothetical protein